MNERLRIINKYTTKSEAQAMECAPQVGAAYIYLIIQAIMYKYVITNFEELYST